MGDFSILGIRIKEFEWVHLGVDDDTIGFLNLQEERKTNK